MSLWEKFKENKRSQNWLLYLTVVLLMVAALFPLSSLSIPLEVDNAVQDFADAVDKFEPNDNLYIMSGLSSAIIGDTRDPEAVILKLFLEKDFDIIVYTGSPESDSILMGILNEIMGTPYWESPMYGEQLIDLGFVTGGGVTVVQHANDIRKLNPTDRFGTPLDDLPAAQDFNSAEDMDLIYGSGAGPLNTWPALLTVPYDIPTLYLYHSGGVAMLSINYLSGQCEGYVAGIKQGAQLENVTGIQGTNMRYMVAAVLLNGLALVGLIASNIYWLYRKMASNR
jgi:hypothetical protein